MTTIEQLTRPAAPPRTLPPQWVRVFRWTAEVFGYVAFWFWVVMIVLAVVVMTVVSQFVTPELSAVRAGHQATVWFPFSMGVGLGLAVLTIGVTNGVTRKAIIRGNLTTAGLAGLGFGVIMTLALLAERWIYERLGWFHGVSDDTLEDALAEGWLVHFAGATLLTTTAIVSGLLVATSYHRYSGWATLLLPLTVGPILLQFVLLGDSFELRWLREDFFVLGGLHRWGVALISVATLAITALAYHLLTRRAVIHAKES